ncbi:uncharacterized protein C3orf20-like isoform X2 [Corythoichthys intestinalis]|uniref:uncharacterized protein C3orf20-like isoform X2 n=1 Tax=Corythoichthys intestinalis TaxID=161448 RepID=UPI0025A59153|nr:uncharacterized protein C3orf20-like isoform X2 [Corythoichthys intestinalis]
MNSLTLLTPYPIYFFDQPAPPRSKKGKVVNVVKPKEEKKEKRSENGKLLKLMKKAKTEDLPEILPGIKEETCEYDSAEDENEDPLANHKRAAPRLLNELGRLLYRTRGAALQAADIFNYSADAALKLSAKDAARFNAARRRKAQKKTTKTIQEDIDAADDPNEVSDLSPTDENMMPSASQESDWLALPRQALDENQPPPRSMCQWVLERLKASKTPHLKPRVMDQVPSTPILRHYVDPKAGMKSKSVLSEPDTFNDEGTPQRIPPLKKLHCRVSNGTSFVYYPSGNMAVCHSPSGLPSGGFYTNVFTDSHTPSILATVTMYGHGSASHPVSSAVTALWDQHGGFMCDWEGKLKKDWSWKPGEEPPEKILVKEPDQILPVTEGTVIARWRRGCQVVGEMTNLRLKVRDLMDAWLKYYRTATGIKRCDKKKSMAMKAKQKKRAKKSEPERANVKLAKTKDKAQEKQEPPAKKTPREAQTKPRGPAKNNKEHSMIQIGPLRIHGNIKQELVILPDHPDSRLINLPRFPVHSRLVPSVPLTVCPLLLRAAMLKQLRENAPKRCCCSTALMPVLLDIEYDAFITGQPQYSQQILVVVVTLPVKPGVTLEQDAIQQLYRRSNRKRTMPCTQCQMDSFRLVRYEVSTGALGCPVNNILLQHRHNVAAGMILMYIRGRLMFLGYVSNGRTFSVLDLQKQIVRTREDYRLGVSLPPDYKFSESAKVSVSSSDVSDANNVEGSAHRLNNDITMTHSPEKDYATETCD